MLILLVRPRILCLIALVISRRALAGTIYSLGTF